MQNTGLFESGSINVFMPDGDPYGLRIVTMDSWNGIVYVTPVEKLANVFQRLGNRAGVYALIDRSNGEKVYIGKAIDLKRRVDNHERLQPSEEFNPEIVIVITTSSETDRFEETEISYLEKLMIDIAKKSRAICININTPSANPTERTEAKVRSYVRRAQVLIPILGLEFATAVVMQEAKLATSRPPQIRPESASIEITSNDVYVSSKRRTGEQAEAVSDGNSITVLKGALVRRDELSSCPTRAKALRRVLLEQGGLIPHDDALYQLTRDVQTHSFSEAAGLLTGSSLNGLDYWRHKVTGKTANEMLSSSP